MASTCERVCGHMKCEALARKERICCIDNGQSCCSGKQRTYVKKLKCLESVLNGKVSEPVSNRKNLLGFLLFQGRLRQQMKSTERLSSKTDFWIVYAVFHSNTDEMWRIFFLGLTSHITCTMAFKVKSIVDEDTLIMTGEKERNVLNAKGKSPFICTNVG